MNDIILSLIGIAIFLGLAYFLRILRSKYKKSFNYAVLTSMVLGLLFGFGLNFLFGVDGAVTKNIVTFSSIFSNSYIRALKMMVIPLVFVAMLTSIINTKAGANLRKIASKTIMVLIGTVAISAVIGIATITVLNVDGNVIAESLQNDEAVAEEIEGLTESQEKLQSKNYAQYITDFIPTNIFEMFTGSERTSTLSVVLFAMFLGYSILELRKRKPEKVVPFVDLANSTKEITLSAIKVILKLTPFGVFGMMTKFGATSSVASLVELSKFLVASYVAMIIMYLIHLAIVALVGLSPKKFANKTWPVLLFGFGSRSSMASVPMNIEAQVDSLGVDEETASISASFGTSIGQNGCAGIYPAMLAILAAQITGVPIDFTFIIQLIIVVSISSFGVAGVGGGATFAAITVLTIMGLDIRIAALLVSIEALVDMARTALNISDSMLAGVVTAKLNGTLDIEVYNSELETSKEI